MDGERRRIHFSYKANVLINRSGPLHRFFFFHWSRLTPNKFLMYLLLTEDIVCSKSFEMELIVVLEEYYLVIDTGVKRFY